MNNQLNMLMQLIFSGLNQNQFISQIVGLNANQVISQIVSENPQANAILNQVQKSGIPTKEYVLQYAKQRNIDISPLLNALKNNGIKL